MRDLLVIAALLLYPWIATPFFTFQIGGQTLALGLIALSLTFLAGYGGMVSLAQMTIAGSAGYVVAILGSSAVSQISLGWPWWLAVPCALALATLFATFIGWLSVRTEGIYTIMITLGDRCRLLLSGATELHPAQRLPGLFPGGAAGGLRRRNGGHRRRSTIWRSPAFSRPTTSSAISCARPSGSRLQGVRDNPRRMNSLGYNVNAHRIGAYAIAGFIAAVGGILLTWYNSLVTPGVVGVTALINILIIAVLGGIGHPIGAFVGALVFVLLQNFAIDLVDRERFNLVIGGIFLLIVLFSPDGLLGLWRRIVPRRACRRLTRSFRAGGRRALNDFIGSRRCRRGLLSG